MNLHGPYGNTPPYDPYNSLSPKEEQNPFTQSQDAATISEQLNSGDSFHENPQTFAAFEEVVIEGTTFRQFTVNGNYPPIYMPPH